MSIQADFQPYIDGNGLLAPNPVPPETLKGSDNGPMFLSEYVIMLAKLDGLSPDKRQDYIDRISNCVGFDLLNRVPITKVTGWNRLTITMGS